MNLRLCGLVLLGATIFPVRDALPQVTTATIYGTVLDASGAAVPGAIATVQHEGTGNNSSLTADSQGGFTATFLAAGRYTITVEAKGFKTFKQTGLDLAAGQRFQLDVRLEVGSVTDAVSVTFR